MIDNLKGVLVYKDPESIVLEVASVGYQIYISTNQNTHSHELGHIVQIFTHLIHKEDLMELYGFHTREERKVFRFLISVTGVGPRLGLKILSTLTEQEVINSILEHNITMLSQVSGLGKKKAEKIIIELKDKFSKHYIYPLQPKETTRSFDHNAFEALLSLGYKEIESQKALQTVMQDKTLKSTESRIKESLKILNQSTHHKTP